MNTGSDTDQVRFDCPLCGGRLDPGFIGAPDEERQWWVDVDGLTETGMSELPTCVNCGTALISNAMLYRRPHDGSHVIGIALTADDRPVSVELIDGAFRITSPGSPTRLIDPADAPGFPHAQAFADMQPWEITEWAVARGFEVWVFHTDAGWAVRTETHQELLDLLTIKRWILRIGLDFGRPLPEVEQLVATHVEPSTLPPAGDNPYIDHPAFKEFTMRDGAVLALIAEGLSFWEIGQEILVGEGFVRRHAIRVKELLGLTDLRQTEELRKAADAWLSTPDGRFRSQILDRHRGGES